MTNVFNSSRLKIERANKHIADIESCIRRLKDTYTVTIERNAETREQSVRYGLPQSDIPVQIALIIGDAVHNLKTALDYAWTTVIAGLVPTAVSNFSKFPVYGTREKLEDALRGREVHTASPALFNLMVSEIQPYSGGNDDIWAIHKLDILDKHRLLIPLVSITALQNIELENETREIIRGDTWAGTHIGWNYVDIPDGYHIKNKGQVAVQVVFKNGFPFEGAEIFGTLSIYSRLSLKIVELLEKL